MLKKVPRWLLAVLKAATYLNMPHALSQRKGHSSIGFYAFISKIKFPMSENIPSIEGERLEAMLALQRMYTSVHRCDGCHCETPKRYSVSGKCVTCQATGAINTTDRHNYRNPGYHDLKAFNEAKGVNLILQVFNRLQRLRNLKGKHGLNE